VPLALHGTSEALVASVDPPRLEQVVENLLENAFKYGADDQPPELRVWREEEEARIAVVDHGAGIPEADRQRIFERFYRAKNAQGITDTGMGLGLYICRRIVQEHRGRIWAEPTDGGGTTFVVALPLTAPTTPDPAPSTEVSSAWPVTPNTEAVADA
jgi:signal transduction histidine kinase